MRMTVLLTASVALLCGVSIGVVIGIVLGWYAFKPEVPDIDWFRDGGA